MALIKCPECGKEISDKAGTCPYCGYPIVEEVSEVEVVGQEQEEKFDIIQKDLEFKDDIVQNNQYGDEKGRRKKSILLGSISVIVVLCVFLALKPKIEETIKLSKAYNKAVEEFEKENYKNAAQDFLKLGDYKDSEEKYLNCRYNEGIGYFEDAKYKLALDCFKKLGKYKDAEEKIKNTYFLIGEEEYNNQNFKEASEAYSNAKNFENSEEKYKDAIYMYAKSLVKIFDYSKAVEQFKKIDYKDSAELAARYERMKTERFFDGKFHFCTNELAILLTQNLKKFDPSITASLKNENSKGAIIEIKKNDLPTKIEIMLSDIDSENGTIGNIAYLCEDMTASDTIAASMFVTIGLADLTLNSDEIKQLCTELLNLGVTEKKKNGICYKSANADVMLGIEIYSDTQPSEKSTKEVDSNGNTPEGLSTDESEWDNWKSNNTCALFPFMSAVEKANFTFSLPSGQEKGHKSGNFIFKEQNKTLENVEFYYGVENQDVYYVGLKAEDENIYRSNDFKEACKRMMHGYNIGWNENLNEPILNLSRERVNEIVDFCFDNNINHCTVENMRIRLVQDAEDNYYSFHIEY